MGHLLKSSAGCLREKSLEALLWLYIGEEPLARQACPLLALAGLSRAVEVAASAPGWGLDDTAAVLASAGERVGEDPSLAGPLLGLAQRLAVAAPEKVGRN